MSLQEDLQDDIKLCEDTLKLLALLERQAKRTSTKCCILTIQDLLEKHLKVLG